MVNKKRIVIVGGGFGGVYSFLNLSRLFKKGEVEITLISKQNYFLFTPLLHEVATGSVNKSNIVQPLRQILGKNKGRIIVSEVKDIDLNHNQLTTSLGQVKYDYLVLAAGSNTNENNFEGHGHFGLKTLEDAEKLKNHIIGCFEKAEHEQDEIEQQKLLTFVVIGGGPTGVELAAELAEFAGETLLSAFLVPKDKLRICLVQSKKKLLPQFDPRLSKKADEYLSQKPYLKVLLNSYVSKITAHEVVLQDGRVFGTYTPILTAGVKPVVLNIFPAVQLNSKGQILTNQFLQIPGFANVFAVGDMSAIACEKSSIPQTAQAAEAAALAAAQNIKALVFSDKPSIFKYKERGQLVSLGNWMAIAEIFHFRFFGHFAWWVWRTIYAAKLVGWANRIRVILDWTIDIFYPRDISKL